MIRILSQAPALPLVVSWEGQSPEEPYGSSFVAASGTTSLCLWAQASVAVLFKGSHSSCWFCVENRLLATLRPQGDHFRLVTWMVWRRMAVLKRLAVA